MAGMEDVVAAVGEDDLLPFGAPFGALSDEVWTRINLPGHELLSLV